MKKDFGGVIWTNHALARLKERNIKQGDAWAAFNRPDSSKFSTEKNAFVYTRKWNDLIIEIVATKNKSGQWVILSVWSKVRVKNKKIDEISILSRFVNMLLGKS